MIPDLIFLKGVLWKVLPPGAHVASMQAIKQRFAYNPLRVQLYDGLLQACVNLVAAGCSSLYLDGSFITEKPEPGDFDEFWDPVGVDRRHLDPVFWDFSNLRFKQKLKFGASSSRQQRGRLHMAEPLSTFLKSKSLPVNSRGL